MVSDPQQMPTRTSEPQTPARTITLTYHLVAIVDLLGQSNALMEIRELPRTNEERNAMMVAIRNSAGRVNAVRNSFSTFLAGLSAPTPAILDSIPEEHRSEFLRFRRTEIRQRWFSDTLVMSVCLIEEPGAAPVNAANGVWATLFGLAGISLIAMTGGIPLRGGVDVGIGLDIFENEVYGPVLVNAHHLECKIAEYPRIAVSANLPSYLDYLEGMAAHADAKAGQLAAGTAARCRQLLCKAPDDGQLMLDVLAPELLKSSPQLREWYPQAHEWVRSQVRRYEAEQNATLRARYSRLLRYFDERVR